jgi:hypothetical protein
MQNLPKLLLLANFLFLLVYGVNGSTMCRSPRYYDHDHGGRKIDHARFLSVLKPEDSEDPEKYRSALELGSELAERFSKKNPEFVSNEFPNYPVDLYGMSKRSLNAIARNENFVSRLIEDYGVMISLDPEQTTPLELLSVAVGWNSFARSSMGSVPRFSSNISFSILTKIALCGALIYDSYCCYVDGEAGSILKELLPS